MDFGLPDNSLIELIEEIDIVLRCVGEKKIHTPMYCTTLAACVCIAYCAPFGSGPHQPRTFAASVVNDSEVPTHSADGFLVLAQVLVSDSVTGADWGLVVSTFLGADALRGDFTLRLTDGVEVAHALPTRVEVCKKTNAELSALKQWRSPKTRANWSVGKIMSPFLEITITTSPEKSTGPQISLFLY